MVPSFGKTTFMPKPVRSDNSSECTAINRFGKAIRLLFMGKKYEFLWQLLLYRRNFKTRKSYQRFPQIQHEIVIPKDNTHSFEAPVILAYSAKNRSASLMKRIPVIMNLKSRKVKLDLNASNHCYFCFYANGGIDSVKNKIDPGKPFDENLYSLTENMIKKLPTVCGSLREAMQTLIKIENF